MGVKDPIDKVPTMVLFWTDTRKLLTYSERHLILGPITLVSATPEEILIQLENGRKVAVVGITDPIAGQFVNPGWYKKNGQDNGK